jgi:phosphatidyl-myo-inositol alpha-mannosyltransferase
VSAAHWVVLGCPYDVSVPGGVQGQVLGIAAALRGRGHLVTVVAPDGAEPRWAHWDEPPAGGPDALDRTLGLGPNTPIRANGSVAPLSLSPRSAWHLRRFVATHRPDVVHLHEPLAPVVGWGALRQQGAPLVGTFHRSGTPRAAAALRPFARWALSRMDVRCAVSQAAAATAQALCGGTYDVLFNGVDLVRFAGAEPWPTDGPTIAFVGRAEERKGLAVLLEAFAGMDEGEATLWICSDGPERASLEARHPGTRQRHWLGRCDDAEVARRLRGAHVLCAPSLFGESFGMVVLEGMAARCAVVASGIAGYEEAAGGHARLVAPGDAGALRTALRAALGQATSGAAQGALDAAFSHAARWSMDELARCYEERYELAERSGGRAPGG